MRQATNRNAKRTGNTMMLGPTGSGKTVFGSFAATHTIPVREGDFVNAFRVSGASFESADDEQLRKFSQALRGNVCGPRNNGSNE